LRRKFLGKHNGRTKTARNSSRKEKEHMKTPMECTALTLPHPIRSANAQFVCKLRKLSCYGTKLAPVATAFAVSPYPGIARRSDAYRRKGNGQLSTEFPDLIPKGTPMDKDRISGAAVQAKGSVKKAAGNVTGDSKLQAEGTLDKAKGRVESAIGGAKDAVRNAN